MISKMNKTDLLFQMMEQPQAYTEQQWQEILSDEECRELYTLMAKTQSAFDVCNKILWNLRIGLIFNFQR